MKELCIHCLVLGRVQGVWYRKSTQERAIALGLTGWVRNLPDGRVEVFACGGKQKLMQLYDWLKQGPELADVEQVTYEEVAWQSFECFLVK
jgi:acylphosphatase